MASLFCFFIGLGELLLGLEFTSRGFSARPILSVGAFRSPWTAFFWGLGLTLLSQSSSAVSCLLIPLFREGGLTLPGLLAALCGVNLGSSLTGWLLCLSLTEIPLWLEALIWAGMGLWGLTARRPLPLGLAFLLSGLALMSRAGAPLAAWPGAAGLLLSCRQPLVGLWVGLLFSGLLQSSGAGMGLLLALARAGALMAPAGYWLVMGLNLGTCSTAFLAALPAGKKGWAVPLCHLGLNLTMVLFWGGVLVLHPVNGVLPPLQLALFHTAFNSTMLLPVFILFLTDHVLPGYAENKQTVKENTG